MKLPRLVLIGITLACLLTLQKPGIVYGQQTSTPTLSISPALYSLQLVPGSKQSYQIRITNAGTSPLPLKASVASLMEDEQAQMTSRTGIHSIQNWVTIPDPDLLIPGNSTRTLSVEIQTPRSIPMGGYYGMIQFEVMNSTPEEQKSLSIQQTIASLIFGSVGTYDPDTNNWSLKDVSFGWPIQFSPDMKSYSFAVENRSLHHYSAKPYFTIRSFRGAATGYALEEKIVFPGATRRWFAAAPLSIPYWGLIRITLSVSIGEGLSVSQSTYLLHIPLNTPYVLGFFACAVVLFFWKKRSRWKHIITALRS